MQDSDLDLTGVRWEKRTYHDVWEELSHYRRRGRTLVVGVDGHSGSGKTTLALGLAAQDRGIALVHTDDLAWHRSFFDWGQRDSERGSNIVVIRPSGGGGGDCAYEFRPQRVSVQPLLIGDGVAPVAVVKCV